MALTDTNFDQVLNALPALDSTQISTVTQRLRALSSLGSFGPSQPQGYGGDWLLDALMAYLRENGQGKTIPPFKRLKAMRTYKSYSEKAESVKAYLSQHFQLTNSITKSAVGQMVFEVFADHLKEWASVDLNAFLMHIDRVPEAVENAFPGYASAGLLQHVIRRTKRLPLSDVG